MLCRDAGSKGLEFIQIKLLLIVLSYAPSAAAVWQCDRVRAMCESNSVQHKSFFKALGLAPLGVLWQPHHNIIISECHNIIIAWFARLVRRKYVIGLFICTLWNACDQYWKAKETPAIFEIVFGCQMGGGRAARARLAKRKYTKCFRLILKSKGNARLFKNYVWGTRLSRRKYIIGWFIFTISNAFD